MLPLNGRVPENLKTATVLFENKKLILFNLKVLIMPKHQPVWLAGERQRREGRVEGVRRAARECVRLVLFSYPFKGQVRNDKHST